MAKKSVCIVGAGPGGLVSAKVLLQTGRFDVTVYEKGPRIGGIWALDQQSKNGFLSPQTPTNLSRYQVAFSDLSWQSISLGEAPVAEPALPMFPKAWQVNRYLETYRQRHIPSELIHLSSTVVAAERSVGGGSTWKITVIDQTGQQSTQQFDYLIIASGFFAAARPLKQVIPKLPADPDTLPIKVVHSGQFRSLSDLFPAGSAAGRAILIIGGSNSAGEAAGVLATQLSDSQHSPDQSARERYQGCKIIHVTPRPLYALPPYLPTDEHSRTFFPLDFGFYNLGKRLPGPIVAGAGLASTFLRDMLHDNIQSSIGGDQSDLGAAALISPGKYDDKRGTVQAALTESYSEFVRSGLIEVIRGKVSSIGVVHDSSVSIEVREEGRSESINDVGAIIYATGFTPIPALDMLDDETKKAVRYDSQSMRLPLILQDWQTSTPAVPDLAFHGFYEGPYWGIMEMQARVTADRWLGKDKISRRTYEVPEDLLSLRAAMHARGLNVPQYWLGDYGGYMEEMAVAMKLQRNDGTLQEREGSVLPARYLADDDDRKEAEITMAEFHECWTACHQGRYVARAAFRALQGHWNIMRRIDSRNSTFPSGVLTGTASFHPRFPSRDKSGQAFDLEYLYVETGVFSTDTGVTMNATRRYVYRYSEARDEMSIWFVKPESSYEVDYLFHNLTFSPPSVTDVEGASIATADHLCVKDMYRTKYRLPLQGIALPTFSIQHCVEGPAKDYTAATTYERPRPTKAA